MLAECVTLGGFPARIEEARRGDESAALIGCVLVNGEEKAVVWRRNGAARWLTADFDLGEHDVDFMIRNFAQDD